MSDTTQNRWPALAGFGVVFITVVVLANLLALGAAWQDKSWGALWIAIVGGPILNGVFALVGLIAMPFLRCQRSQFSVWRPVVLSLGGPDCRHCL